MENTRDGEKMGLFIQGRSDDIDRRIAETREMLENSRRFLDNLREDEKRTRDYLTELVTNLEKQFDRLRREQTQPDPNGPVAISSTDEHG